MSYTKNTLKHDLCQLGVRNKMGRRLKNRLLLLLTDKERKEERRIKQVEIARAINISHNTIASWLRNDVTKLEAHVIEGLCEYFQCDLSDLLYFEETDEGTPNPYVPDDS
jgi:putative transcriptional regulator